VTAKLDHLVTSGTFSLDGGTWEVDNNVWIVGDDTECAVIDAPHDAAAIQAAVGSRRLTAILCTHAHDDHIDAAAALVGATGAPIWLHPADRELWEQTYQRRHAVRGRPGRDRALVLRLRHDHRLDPGRLLVLDPGTVVHTGTATTPPSARKHPTCRNGSPAGTDQRAGEEHKPRAFGTQPSRWIQGARP
jgi:glyoxylase-like metal-dependent hydrolase (beta-lactamase superfamily II)